MRKGLLFLVLLVAGVVPQGSSGAVAAKSRVPRWPYPETRCEQQPRTPAPDEFGAPVTFGGDEHTNITGVGFERRDGRLVAVSTGQEGTLRRWSLPALEQIGEPEPARELDRPSPPTGVLNGRRVRVLAGDEMRAVDVATGRQVGPSTYLGEDNTVNAVALLTLGGRLIAAVNDNGGDENYPGLDNVDLWDLASGKRTGVIEGDFATVRTATVGGRTVLLTVNRGPGVLGTVSLWDPRTRQEIARLPGNPPPADPADISSRRMYAQVFLAVAELDGRPVALTGGGDNALRLWDLTTATQLAARTPTGHIDEVVAFTVARLGGREVVVSGGADRTVMVWDLRTGERVGAPLKSLPGLTYPMFTDLPELPPYLLTWDDIPRYWRLEPTGKLEQVMRGFGPGSILPFRGRLAHLGEVDGEVRLRDVATGAFIGASIPVTGDQPASRAALARLNGRDVVIDVRSRIRIWDLETGRRVGTIRDVRSPGNREPGAAVVEARCTTLVLAATGTSVRVWDLRTGRELQPLLGHTDKLSQIRTGVIGDRPIAVTTSADGTARVWDLTSGAQIGPAIQVGRRYGVIQLAYLDGHTMLIRAGYEERVRRWDLNPA